MADTKKVSPAPTYADYVNENLGVYEADFDNGRDCCTVFKSNERMEEGVSGLKKIDTTYENYSESIVTAPRSSDAPMPMDLWRYPHRRT